MTYVGVRIVVVAAALAVAVASEAQTPAPGAGGAGAPHPSMRAAGMPLRDGALAPGMLTVRVVRGSFDNNVPDQAVQVEVTGAGVEHAQTGADGRAQFAHLPVGATVRAAALVDGERLTSDTFEMSSEAGIRILLIAGGETSPGATAAGDASLPPIAPAAAVGVPAASAPAFAAQAAAAAGGSPASVVAIRAFLACATLVAFALVYVQWRGQGTRRMRAPVDDEQRA